MEHDVFYQAMLARDRRFDGRFFVGVKTTGVYCRPICPAKPRRENVEFFSSAAAAERSGYRPCLRCRPECAPLSAAWTGRSAIVERALRAIASEGFFELNEDRFAARFGVTARHLRRLFVDEVGLTPKQIAFRTRLDFARTLAAESDLPMSDVALGAGFASLRRFNDAFKKRFRRPPGSLRARRGRRPSAGPAEEEGGSTGLEMSLAYRPPFDWNASAEFYEAHRIAGVESVADGTYERAFRIGSKVGFLRATNDEARSRLRLRVWIDDPSALFSVAQTARRAFDLDSDPIAVANAFRSHPFLNGLWRRRPGLRIARGWDCYEAAVCSVLGQFVSLGHARALIGQLVERHGEAAVHPETGATWRIFPSPEALAEADLDFLKTTRARKAAIRDLSRAVLSGDLDLRAPRDADETRKALLSIRGIGPWSAECILLRAFGETDAFPASDLILKRALETHPNLDVEKTRPWRSYVAIYLWKRYAGELSRTSKRKGAAK